MLCVVPSQMVSKAWVGIQWEERGQLSVNLASNLQNNRPLFCVVDFGQVKYSEAIALYQSLLEQIPIFFSVSYDVKSSIKHYIW